MKRTHSLPRPAHFQKHQTLRTKDARIATALPQHLFEFLQRGGPITLAAVCVAEIRSRGYPGARVAVDVGGDAEGGGEDGDGFGEVVEVVEYHA